MKAKASAVAQKLLNLYRQAHVINGGWAALNRVFVDEATEDVVAELYDLPTGKLLAAHINNLRSGKTPMDSIARELLPYGGMMAETDATINMSDAELNDLIGAIDSFAPNENGLNAFMATPVIARFGSEWITQIKNALGGNSDALNKFDKIVHIATAYKMWDDANNILAKPITDRERAEVQADMPEYETYLPMFGDEGKNLLRRLRAATSSMPKNDATAA